MMENPNKICFIICVNNDFWFRECVRYIEWLDVPEGMEIEILEIREAASMTAGYNEGMNSTDAKYKVYMHQDAFIINRFFIHDILSIFKQNAGIGMIGMVGSEHIPENGVMWTESRVQEAPEKAAWENYRYDVKDGLWNVACVDGLLMVTQYDVPWREDLFDGWDFYDVSQSCEMRKRGYEVVVPVQKHAWYIHDDKRVLSLWNYDKYRKIFIEHYMQPEM